MKSAILLTGALLAIGYSATAQGTFTLQAANSAQGISYRAADGGAVIVNTTSWTVQALQGATSLFTGPATIASLGRINNTTTPAVSGSFANDVVNNIVARLWTGAASYAAAQTTPGASWGTSLPFSQTLGGPPVGGGPSISSPSMANMQAFTVQITPVPEPSVIALAGLGLGGLILARRSKKA